MPRIHRVVVDININIDMPRIQLLDFAKDSHLLLIGS